MSLEAVRQLTQTESNNRERKLAAEAQARQLIADAERDGAALLQKKHDEAIAQGKKQLREAEEQAQARIAEIMRSADADARAQKQRAEQRLESAADLIVERIVKH